MNQTFAYRKSAALISQYDTMSQYFTEHFYCLNEHEIIGNYPKSIFVKKTFPLKAKMNEIIRRAFESGIIEHWNKMLTKRINNVDSKDMERIGVLKFDHILGTLMLFLIGCICALLTFCVEIIVYDMIQKGNRKGYQKELLIIANKILDDKRHCYFLVDNPKGNDDNYNLALFMKKSKQK